MALVGFSSAALTSFTLFSKLNHRASYGDPVMWSYWISVQVARQAYLVLEVKESNTPRRILIFIFY